mgnify:CR=1 FL=1
MTETTQLSGKIKLLFRFVLLFRKKKLDKQARHGVALRQTCDTVCRRTFDKADTAERRFGIHLIVFLAAPRRAINPKASVCKTKQRLIAVDNACVGKGFEP